jgi:hypothetical protein
VTSRGGRPSDEDSGYEEESFGRPFLGHQIQAEAPGPDRAIESIEEAPGGHNRPYLMTGGRTGGGAAGIGIETILVMDHYAAANRNAWSREMKMIIAVCDAPVAVAEVAARIGLPIGVVQVLTGDLVSAGVLLRSASPLSQADDVLFIERLIQGVAAL